MVFRPPVAPSESWNDLSLNALQLMVESFDRAMHEAATSAEEKLKALAFATDGNTPGAHLESTVMACSDALDRAQQELQCWVGDLTVARRVYQNRLIATAIAEGE